MKFKFALWAFLILAVTTTRAQDTNTPSDSKPINWWARKHQAFPIAFETEQGLGSGISLGYLYNPDRGRHYYFGLQFKTTLREENRQIAVTRIGPTRGGSLSLTSHMYSMELMQRYVFIPTGVVSPFISVDLGWRSISQELDTSYFYDTGFPFGWVMSGDYETNSPKQTFTADLGAGCRVRVWQQMTVFARLGLKFAKRSALIDQRSVNYDTDGIRYNYQDTKPTVVTFSFGFLF